MNQPMKVLTIANSRNKNLSVSIPAHHIVAFEQASDGSCFISLTNDKQYHTQQAHAEVVNQWEELFY